MKTFKNIYVVYILVILLISFIVLIVSDSDMATYLGGEDGFFESGTAIWFALASILFFILYKKDHSGNDFFKFTFKKNIFFLLLGFLFLFGAGEEISWGQRIFNIETPDSFKEKNIQGELNIHNLDIFHSKDHNKVKKTGWARFFSAGRLFTAFWFLWCFLLPILNRYNSKIAGLVAKLNIPILPIGLGLIFLINHILSKIAEVFAAPDYLHYITETKEHNFGLLFFIVSVWFLKTRDETKAAA